jgi:hypothetical protein
MEGVLPEYRYNTYTSETAKAISMGTGWLPESVEKFRTPVAIDHLVQSYTGGMGRYALNAIDSLLIKSGVSEDPVKPDGGLHNVPVVKAFLVRHPSLSLKPVIEFQERHEKVQQKLNTVRKLRRELRYEDAYELMDQYTFVRLNSIDKTISDLKRAIYQIHALREVKDMSKEELADFKQERIDVLTHQVIELSVVGNQIYDQLEIPD